MHIYINYVAILQFSHFVNGNSKADVTIFSASLAHDYSLTDMTWKPHELWRQRGVPGHQLQTKLDTSAQLCSTTSPNFIMKATTQRAPTALSFSCHPSIHPSSRMCWAEVKGHCHVPEVNAWLTYQSPFNAKSPLSDISSNRSTGDRTDEAGTQERWLSMCVKSVCAVV